MKHVLPTAFVVLIVLGVSCNGFREDEITCEQAVAHLIDCCPDTSFLGLTCEHINAKGCDQNATDEIFPDLRIDQARCVREKSCDELRPSLCRDIAAGQYDRCN